MTDGTASVDLLPEEELRARLDEAAGGAPDPEAARRALELLRPSLALMAAEEGEPAGRSRLGGLPPLPAEVEWPTFDGHPLTLAAQLDCAALLPLLGEEKRLPADGLLLFFYDDSFDGLASTDVCVLQVAGDAPERPAPPKTPVNPAFPLAAVRTPSLPVSFSDAVAEFFADLDFVDAMTAVGALNDVLPVIDSRLLGWHDGGAGGLDGFRPLLQLDTVDGADWGEVVNIAYWIDDDALAAGDFASAYYGIEVA